MNLELDGSRNGFYQWDTGQQLVITGADTCKEIHFCHTSDERALVCRIREEDGKRVVDVPNILLQKAEMLIAYAYEEGEGHRTLWKKSFAVKPRPRPEAYVYTQTEVLSYGTLADRLEILEGEGLANAVTKYLKDHPVQAGATAEEAAQILQNKESIEKLADSKLDASGLPGAVEDALNLAKQSGEFKGAPGDDYVLTEADKTEIAEQAAQLVEIPVGGGGGAVAPELLYAVTAENVVEVSQDIDWKGHTNFYIVTGAEKESGNAVNIKSARLVLSNVEFTFGYYTSFLKDTATKGSVSHELRMVSPNHCACVYGSYTISKDGTTGNFTLQGSGSACPTPKISGLHGKATVIPNTADGICITLSAEVPSLSVWVYGF